MSITAVMVDVDGVLVAQPENQRWDRNLERDLSLSPALLHEAFFQQHWDAVVNGRAALRERLDPVLRDIAPSITSDTLIDYWFRHDAHLNTALLAEIRVLRSEGMLVCLATVQEHERAAYLWHGLDLQASFDSLFYSAQIGHSKPAPEFYAAIEDRTGLAPDQIFFVDDKADNVAVALTRGWHAAVWTGQDTLGDLLAAIE